MSESLRILLADDHTLVREGVRRILESQRSAWAVSEVSDGEAAIAKVATGEVDVLVLDLAMPGRDGLEVLAEVKKSRPSVRVLVLTMHDDPAYVSRAVQSGADGYLLKDSAVQDLVTAIDTVMEGRAYYAPAVQRALSEIVRGKAAEERPLEQLTEREREVLKLVAEGYPTKEIAARLGISHRTVESHRANLMRKLDLRSVAKLTQFAVREGLVEPR